MAFRVLIPSDISEPGKKYLRDRGYEIRMGRGLDEQTIMEDVQGCHAILARNEAITRSIMDSEKMLKVVSKHGVGLDKIDLNAAKELGVWVTYGPMSNVEAVSEHTMMMILALAKKLIIFDRETKAGHFGIRNELKGCDLKGKTLGIVGMGKIGSLVAKKAIYGFEMNVIGYDPYVTTGNRIPAIEYTSDIQDVFQKSDFVTLHIPACPENKGIINHSLISLMKPSAYMINIARGEILNEQDLCIAIQEGKIAGAALDVYNPEPPAANNPLFSLPNVVCTPHNASLTLETMDRMGLHAAQGIHEILSGTSPSWLAVSPNEPRS